MLAEILGTISNIRKYIRNDNAMEILKSFEILKLLCN